MYSDILKLIKTTQDRNDLLISLREISAEIDQPNKSVQGLIDELIPLKYSTRINIEEASKNPKDFFTNLISEIENMPVVNMEIGFEPTQKLVDTVLAWFDTNISRQVLLEIAVNPQIVLGAKIGFNGKFFDGTNNATK